MRRNAEQTGGKTAIIFEGQALNWRQLNQAVEAMSGFFAGRLGSDKQKLVALLLTNSPEFIITYLAVLRAGHMAIPLDPAYKKLELDAIIERISPQLVITDQRYSRQISRRLAEVVMIENLLNQDFPDGGRLRLPAGRQIASLTFTSGTSGRPKAVPNTHANHIWNIEVCSKVWKWTPADTMLLILPLSHWYGLVMGLAGAVYHGNTVYLYQQAFDPKTMLDELSSGRISFFTHTPLGYLKMLSYQPAKQYDLSAVRLCVSGSAALPPAVWRNFKDRFGIEILETYGSSETGRIAGNRLDERVLGTPGRPLPGVNTRLNKDSELEVKSGGLFPGYYQNEQATGAARAPGGFWRTGDIAEIKDGYIYLKGRRQERIRRFGYTISPRDVEWAMHQHPKVKDIYVMGLQRPGQPNDELVYFIVGQITEDEIKSYTKANLLFAWRPDRIVHLEDLPRNRSGKPQIGRLKEMAV